MAGLVAMPPNSDSPKARDYRRRLMTQVITNLQQTGTPLTPAVQAALHTVPRHLFTPGVALAEAYENRVIPLKLTGRQLISSISQPTMVALMLHQLDLAPGHHVLEIGAGSGYNAALLAELVGPTGRVTTIDLDADLTASARANLAAAGYAHVNVITADGALGHPPHAPYDRIILTAATADLAPAWFQQLLPTGLCVAPLALLPHGSHLSVAFAPLSVGLWRSQSIVECTFTPLRGALFASNLTNLAPLGPNNNITIERGDHLPTPAADLTSLLDQSPIEIPTDLAITPLTAYRDLLLWLAAHIPTTRLIFARRTPRSVRTFGDLLGPAFRLRREISALVVPACFSPAPTLGLALLTAEARAQSEITRPLALTIRSWGHPTIAHQLHSHLAQWHAAGRPGLNRLALTAALRGIEHPDTPAAITRPNATFFLSWPDPAAP